MIKPTIGRVVWVQNRYGSTDTSQPEPALISYVWSDTMINVGGFDHNGMPFNSTSLRLRQDDEDAPQGAYAEWMPYQKGQAAKTETLEIAAAARAAGPTGY